MKLFQKLFLVTLFFPVVTACNNSPEAVPTSAVQAAVSESADNTAVVADATTNIPPTETPIPPTPTPSEPLAALVNGEPLYLADYEAELVRYEQAQAELGDTAVAAENHRRTVLDYLVERMLVAQAAADQGITVTNEVIDQEMAALREKAGETGNFEAWLERYNWTEEAFRDEIEASLIRGQMVTAVTKDAPIVVEQVRARYIQLDDAALANTLLTQIQNGDDFGFLAQQYSLDRMTAENGGDLGFFARGSLLVPELETAAFNLQNPGDVSDVISVTDESGQTTYYLVQLTERDLQRPLPPGMQYTVLDQVFQSWLDELRQAATIEQFIDTSS